MILSSLTDEELVSLTDSQVTTTELEQELCNRLKNTLDLSYVQQDKLSEIAHIATPEEQQELL